MTTPPPEPRDLVPLPPPPDVDSTVLGGLPVALVPPGPPKQGE